MKISRHRSLRFVGWVAAYVVALHAILASFVALPSVAAAAAANGIVALCLTSDSGDMDADTSTTHGGSQHCAICVTGTSAAPPPSSDPAYVAFAIDATLDAARQDLPPPSAPPTHQGNPRAPPSLA